MEEVERLKRLAEAFRFFAARVDGADEGERPRDRGRSEIVFDYRSTSALRSPRYLGTSDG